MSRTWMYQRVTNTPSLGIPSARVHSVGAAGRLGDTPDTPFVVIRAMLAAPALLPSFPVQNNPFQVWVHDSQGSMTKIDQAIKALEEWLPTQAPAQFGDEYIFEAHWDGNSDDLFDDHYKTNCRHGDFTLKVKKGGA